MKLKIYDINEDTDVPIDDDLNLQFLNEGDTIILNDSHFVIRYKDYYVATNILIFGVIDNLKYAISIHS